MEYDEVIEIFKDLQRQGYINSNRKIKPKSLLNFETCCSFAAYHKLSESDNRSEENFFIGYDSDLIEFLEKSTLMCTLLHEEGHMRFFMEKLDWDNKKIDRIPEITDQLKQENELKADKYAARIVLEGFTEIDPCQTMKALFSAYQKCCDKHWTCSYKRGFMKFLNKINGHPEDFHPPPDERIRAIEKYCKEKRMVT